MAHVKGGGGGTSGPLDVTPPADTTEAVAAGTGLAAKTFGAFGGTDAGEIASYNAVTVNAAGTCSWSGSGLGPYTPTDADGNAGVLYLQALDASGNVLATAIHDYARAAAAGSSYPDAILDWSASSETFAAGPGSYTIGGLGVTYDYNGTSGPDTIDLTNGVLTVTTSAGGRAYLVIDLGEDVSREAVAHYLTCTGLSAAAGTQIIYKVAANATIGNANGQSQILIGTSGSETAIRTREANSASNFTTCNNHTVTDITTTPTRVCLRVLGDKWADSYDQGSAALPTDGAALANTGTNDYQDGSGANAPNDRRYVHLLVLEDATIRIGSQALREAP